VDKIWRQALEAIGVSAPFLYATATYLFFHWLDKKASGQAKAAISGWLQKRYDRASVGKATLELFEGLYGYPFFSVRTIIRVVLYSLILHLVVYYEFVVGTQYTNFWLYSYALPGVFVNIFSDYVSLFIVRKWLNIGITRPFFALVTGPIIGGY
jgi:hypothetical protein